MSEASPYRRAKVRPANTSVRGLSGTPAQASCGSTARGLVARPRVADNPVVMETRLQAMESDARSDPGAPIRLVLPPQASRVVLCAIYLIGLSLLGLFALSEAASARTAVAKATVLFVGLFSLGILVLWGWAALQKHRNPSEVTEDMVRLRVGLRRRERVILLDSIASVGMVFQILQRPTGWFSYLWLEDGEAVPLGLGAWIGNRSDVEDWEKLAATPPGALCIEVLERAKARQGESGPIARDRITDRRGLGTTRAYWSANRSLYAART
jgi:hypothetical protein